MQKLILFSALCMSFFLAGCGGPSALEYNDALVQATKQCLSDEVQIWEALAQQDVVSAQDALGLAKTSCETSQTTITQLADFKGDAQLADAVHTLLALELQYLGVLEQVLSYSTDTAWTDAQQNAYLALQEELAALRSQAVTQSEQVVFLQQQFAGQHHFSLEETMFSASHPDPLAADDEGIAPEEAAIEMEESL